MLSLSSLLVVFLTLTLSSLAVFWARRAGVPHTVFLVAIGVVLGLLTYFPAFDFLTDLAITPELLFFVFLPTLIFESAYNIRLRKLIEDGPVITILSVGSLLVSAAVIGFALQWILGLMGIAIPLIITLLFGALISATDPVAVLALFKEYGAPRRLSLIFEGESLFNDATAVALFFVVLEVLIHGFHGAETVLAGMVMFTIMIAGGIAFGLFMGLAFAQLIGMTRESEAASITLTIVLAHVTFLLSELISHNLVIGGTHIFLSSIIATTVASIIMGNYGRAKIHPRAEEFVEKLWGQLAFMVNSVIFILIGLLFVSLPLTSAEIYIPIIVTILVVATARAISIYPLIGMFNRFTAPARRIPNGWQHLLSWGSLRGALAVTMVLLIPETLSIPGWTLSVSPRDFILSLTIGCIFATIFIKATTIQRLMRALTLDTLTDIETLERQEALALIHRTVVARLSYYADRGYISASVFTEFSTEHTRAYQEACTAVRAFGADTQKNLTDRVIRMYAIGIERRYLKDLYRYGEITEHTFKRIAHKLDVQFEAIERGTLAPDMHIHTRDGDIIERLVRTLREILRPQSEQKRINESYLYYRAQTIISRKVLKELGEIDGKDAEPIFTKHALQGVVALYTQFREQTQEKMRQLEASHPAETEQLKRELATFAVFKVEEQTLDDLYEKELVTPKLYIALKEELEGAT